MTDTVSFGLAPLDSVDAQYIRQWRNDYSIWRWCRQSDFISDVEQDNWFESQALDPSIRMYKVVRSTSGELGTRTAGVCGFTSINMLSRHAEFSLYIAPDHQKKGCGKIALALLLAHGFSNLGFNMIWGEVIAGNPAMKLFKEIGFKLDGVRRHFYWKDGGLYDASIISITAGEWDVRTNRARGDNAQSGDNDISGLPDLGPEQAPNRAFDSADISDIQT